MKTLMGSALVLAALVFVTAGQGKPDVDRLGEKIANQLKSRLSGWDYTSVEPFGPSSNIVVQMWSSKNNTVKVAVAIRESVEDAKKEVKSFLQFRRDTEQLSGFGDEAFAPERDGADIVLRRGRHVIYINTRVDADGYAEAQTRVASERETERKAEVHRIGREFAKQLSSIEFE